ncbi:MAG: glucose 1-dehydrogenase [Chloroflexi bacterium]|nr:glucose 1-dehydrogenase [Chloroflexota bacterium]
MSALLQQLFSLEGKTALVTGASGGIGAILATALAEAGARVGVHGRSTERVAEACHQIEAKGGQAVPFIADLSEVAANRKLIDEAAAKLGRLDILLNCAAINRRKPLSEITPDDYDAIMATNLRSLFFLCQAAQPHMRAQGGGKIINISSINERYGLGTVSVYGAAKAGVAQVSRVMAVEWAKDNIQVNCIVPGFIMTPLTAQPLWGVEQRSQWLHDRIPLRRPGLPEDLIGATLLLASSAANYMTGSAITVDGGFFAGGSWERDQ